MDRKRAASFNAAVATLAVFACAAVSGAQNLADRPAPITPGDKTEIEQHLDQLTSAVDNLRQRLKESQSEMDALRAELILLRTQLAAKDRSEEAGRAADSLRASVEELQEQAEIVKAEVKQHDQTKVESASKYPVRISGVLLFTSVLNSGNADNMDVPVVALQGKPNSITGSLSTTARQTILGLDASGPSLWGAKSSANISIDFFGGMPYADYTTAAGSVRLRTAHAGLEWRSRSLSLDFDRPLISPLQPTSWITVGEPALAWSGNLWTWTPQLKFRENSILQNHRISAEFGLIDPAAPGAPAGNGLRVPNAAERSRQPGYEARVGYAFSLGEHPLDLGAGGYYSRQTYASARHLDAWAGTADWNISLLHALALSGEIYRGRAIGGLGGGAFKDYVTYAEYTRLRGLDAEGGWGQLKLKLSPSLEANLAAGQDNAFANDLRTSDLVTEQNNYANLARNQSVFANFVYRPKSYLLFSTEYRQVESWPITGKVSRDRILGLAAGYLF